MPKHCKTFQIRLKFMRTCLVICEVFLDFFCSPLPLSFLIGRQGWGQGEVSGIHLHLSQHSFVPFYSPGPVAVPLDVLEDVLPLLHLPHLPHPHLVPEAGPVPHPPAGEVTGGGGEHVFRESLQVPESSET